MKTYLFNDCGVCTNADIIDLVGNSFISIAEHDGGVIYGYNLDYDQAGCCSPCTISGEHFANREQCINAAYLDAIKVTQSKIDWYSLPFGRSDHKRSIETSKVLLKVLQRRLEHKPKFVQLELFT